MAPTDKDLPAIKDEIVPQGGAEPAVDASEEVKSDKVAQAPVFSLGNNDIADWLTHSSSNSPSSAVGNARFVPGLLLVEADNRQGGVRALTLLESGAGTQAPGTAAHTSAETRAPAGGLPEGAVVFIPPYTGAVGVDLDDRDPEKVRATAGPERPVHPGLREALTPADSARLVNLQLISKPYAGEELSLSEVPFGSHIIKKDDTLSGIARAHLGEAATEADITAYVKEIQTVNGLDPRDVLTPGDPLALPGHMIVPDQGTALVVEVGNSAVVTFKDGRQLFINEGGRRLERKTNADGSYTETHTGPRPEDTFTLTRTADGKFLISEKPGAPPHEVNPNKDVRAAHARLHDLVEAKVSDPATRAKIAADMARFEDRARTAGLQDSEVLETYQHATRLLEAKDGKVTEAQRVQLAEQILAQAADPRIIDQGAHKTCNVTSMEIQMYSREPAKAARLVADVALTGEYTAPGGLKVALDEQSLKPDVEASMSFTADATRSFATQLYNVTAVNLVLKSEGDKVRYTQGLRNPLRPDDTGERQIDIATGKEISTEPVAQPDQIVKSYHLISGRQDRDLMLINKAFPLESSLTEKFDSPESFERKLAELKAKGRFPVTIAVQTISEPFYSDSGSGTAGGSGGGHVLNIIDFQPGPPPKVAIDNTWGSGNDHRDEFMPLSDVYRATLTPAAATLALQDDLLKARENGKVDLLGETEFLRLIKVLGAAADGDIAKELAGQMEYTRKLFTQQRDEGKLNLPEAELTLQKQMHVYMLLNKEGQLAFLTAAETNEAMPDDLRAEAVGSVAFDLYTEKNTRTAAGTWDAESEKTYQRQLQLAADLFARLPEAERKRLNEMIERVAPDFKMPAPTPPPPPPEQPNIFKRAWRFFFG